MSSPIHINAGTNHIQSSTGAGTVLPDILNVLTNSTQYLLNPSYQPGIWFYILVFLVTFLGSVFVITPVPENSLLFIAGAMVANQQVLLGWLLIASIAGAYVGYDLNYWSGRFLNLAVCRMTCPHIFRTTNLQKTEDLMKKFGPIAVIISRFIPAVNLPPFFAGLNSMNYIRYMAVNITGAALWASITVLLGYFIGSFDIVQDYLNILFGLVILALIVTFIYAGVTLIRGWGSNKGKLPDSPG